jgi:hypothetical protein
MMHHEAAFADMQVSDAARVRLDGTRAASARDTDFA